MLKENDLGILTYIETICTCLIKQWDLDPIMDGCRANRLAELILQTLILMEF